MNGFVFWQKWLFYSSLLFSFYGICLAIAPDTRLFAVYNEQLWLQIGILHPHSWQLNAMRDFLCGPLGGTICATYLLTAWIARFPFRNREKWSWQAILVAFCCWFVLDSFVALKAHAVFHFFYFNLPSFLVKLLPLVGTYRQFFHAGAALSGKATQGK